MLASATDKSLALGGASLPAFGNTLLVILLAIVSYFVTLFVVDSGAAFAGLEPNADFVVLLAALLVAAAIVAGSITPWSAMSVVPETGREQPPRE